jgi:PAS domain S-box-containing protein
MYTINLDGRLLMPDLPDDKQATTALVARSAIALQHNVQRFRAIFDSVSEPIALLKPNGNLIEVNPTAVKSLGIKAQEALDLPFWSAHCWSFSLAVQQQLQTSISRAAQGASICYETEVMGADDRLLPLDFSLTPIRDPQGEIVLILAQGLALRTNELTNCSQGKHFHDRLYSERLSVAIRVAKAGAWSWDVNNQQVFWTPEFEILFDYEPGSTQQLYREWIDRVHPDDRERVETQLQQTIHHQLPEFRCDYRIVWRDGQIRWIATIGELHSQPQSNPQMSGLVYDITDRKRDEAALHRSEEFTRRILESDLDCINVLDSQGRLVYMNSGGQVMMEIDDFATVANTHWLDSWQSDDPEAAAGAFATAKAGGVGKFDGYCATTKGTPKWWSVVITPLADIGDDLGQILLVARDITERKQLELINQAQTTELQQLNHALMLTQQQLSERNEELDRFGCSVAHDLKAPLRSIANLSAWIEEDLSDRILENDRQQFHLLRQRVKRMDALVDGLLNYSRLGKQDLAIETVDVAQLLAEVIDSLASSSFQIEILSALPILDTKRILLSQVFANLISNAIKHHSRAAGRIVISAKDLGDRYQFSIADDGDGIPQGEARQRIFDIFHTLKPSSSNENTGIGLALVKKIVEGEGGQIWVDDYPATATREMCGGKTLKPKIEELQPQINGACFCFTWLKPNKHSF